jgi:hypothetical protein
MTRAKAYPLRYSELRRRLERFGAIELRRRGKGSHRVFIRRDPKSGEERMCVVKCHGEHTEIDGSDVTACLRRLCFTQDEVDSFWEQ